MNHLKISHLIAKPVLTDFQSQNPQCSVLYQRFCSIRLNKSCPNLSAIMSSFSTGNL